MKSLSQLHKVDIEHLVAETFARGPAVANKLATVIDLQSDRYDLSMVGRVPQVREMLGQIMPARLVGEQITGKLRKWEDSFEIAVEDIELGRLGEYDTLIADLAAEAAEHPDALAVDTLLNGTSVTAFDGKALFADDHPDGAGGVYDNLLAGTGAGSLNVIYTDWGSAKAAMRSFSPFKSNAADTRKFNKAPNAVICPVGLEEYFKMLFTSDKLLLAGTETQNIYRGDVPAENIIARAELDASDANDWYAAYIPPAGEGRAKGKRMKSLMVLRWKQPKVYFDEKDMISRGVVVVSVQMHHVVVPGAPWMIEKMVNT